MKSLLEAIPPLPAQSSQGASSVPQISHFVHGSVTQSTPGVSSTAHDFSLTGRAVTQSGHDNTKGVALSSQDTHVVRPAATSPSINISKFPGPAVSKTGSGAQTLSGTWPQQQHLSLPQSAQAVSQTGQASSRSTGSWPSFATPRDCACGLRFCTFFGAR